MKNIKVSNCRECPFCNKDNEYGSDHCNLDSNIYVKSISEELPKDAVHDDCPLRNSNVVVELLKDCECVYHTLPNQEPIKVIECVYCKSNRICTCTPERLKNGNVCVFCYQPESIYNKLKP